MFKRIFNSTEALCNKKSKQIRFTRFLRRSRPKFRAAICCSVASL